MLINYIYKAQYKKIKKKFKYFAEDLKDRDTFLENYYYYIIIIIRRRRSDSTVNYLPRENCIRFLDRKKLLKVNIYNYYSDIKKAFIAKPIPENSFF